jgi:hypothetical protein
MWTLNGGREVTKVVLEKLNIASTCGSTTLSASLPETIGPEEFGAVAQCMRSRLLREVRLERRQCSTILTSDGLIRLIKEEEARRVAEKAKEQTHTPNRFAWGRGEV